MTNETEEDQDDHLPFVGNPVDKGPITLVKITTEQGANEVDPATARKLSVQN